MSVVTAWNALAGGEGLHPNQTVVTQGSGGVSLFALQLAKALGAWVIATTSSPEKAVQFLAMNRAIEANGLHSVIASRRW